MSLRFFLVTLCLLLSLPAARADEFLDPEIAFRQNVSVIDGQTIEVGFAIAPGYYLYRERFRFEIEPGSSGKTGPVLGEPIFPQGKLKDDENFGQVEVYYDQVDIRLPVERLDAGPLEFTLKTTSMGCADAGLCYPPRTVATKIELPAVGAPVGNQPSSSVSESDGDEAGQIFAFLKNARLWLVLLSFFGFGLLLALTPCVYPMIPILSGIIVKSSGKDGQNISHGRAFTLSLAYVLGMALVYALVGVAAGLTGSLLLVSLQNPWVVGSFALIFVLLALSMFGLYELQMPTVLQNRINAESSHIKGGSLPAVATMGALSALVAGPCVAAPLAGALLYISQTRDAWLGGSALFFLGLGMGAPLLAIGTSAGALLPRSGPWMTTIKNAFGVILLGTALWFVAPFLPPPVVLGACALLLIIPAIFLHALDTLPPNARAAHRFLKGIGVIMLLVGIAYLVGALAGAQDPLRPLGFLSANASEQGQNPARNTAETQTRFVRVSNNAELDEKLAEAKASGQPVLLDFYADWCIECKKMERTTFSDPEINRQMQAFVLLQADVTDSSVADNHALLKRFELWGPPGIIFWDRNGELQKNTRVVGFQDAAAFKKTLERLL